MASPIREPQSAIVAQFTIPSKGTWNSFAIHSIPQDALFHSLNVFLRYGKLRSRPGLAQFGHQTFHFPILGGAMNVTPSDKMIIVVDKNHLYFMSEKEDSWTTNSILSNGQPLVIASDDFSVVDFAFMQTSGDYVALMASEGYTLKKWTSGIRTVETVVGSNIPLAKSVCIAASRAVCLVPPHTVVWSRVNDYSTFDPLAYTRKAQTGDMGILVESITSLSFALYKERSIHLARAQAAIDEGTAFAFQEPLYVEGPAGIYALANIGGVHFYMTRNGRIALFDGQRYPQWIADGLWLFLQNDIYQPFSHLIRASYDYRLNTLTFYYPRNDNPNFLTGMVLINLPFAEDQGMKAFLGQSEEPVTHCCEMRFDQSIDRSLLFSAPKSESDHCKVFTFDENAQTDGESRYHCSFQTGLQPMPDGKHILVTVESFLERSSGYGSVFIEPVINDALENRSGTIPDLSGQWIDLETNPIREYKGFGQQVRFMGLKYSWDSSNTVRYSGSTIIASTSPRYHV
jgi:hypothetical protein